jgi:hypothetical protein
MPAVHSEAYDLLIQRAKPATRRTTMMRAFPITWTSIQIALAGASTYVLCTTDLLRGAAVFFH